MSRSGMIGVWLEYNRYEDAAIENIVWHITLGATRVS